MPSLEGHARQTLCKALFYGDSGSGKTGSLASLANLGHRLVIQDYDNGLDILHAFVKPEMLKNIYYATLTDKMKGSAFGAIPVGVPTALTKGMKLLDNWVDGSTNLGRITSWGPDTTFICDSLTFMGDAALRYVRVINGRGPEDPTWQSDWGQAMNMQEGFLELLYSDAVKCNVIVTSHIAMIGGDEKTGAGAKGMPTALGRKLPPKVPRWFNNTLRATTLGGGRRVIRTNSTEELELKNTRPNDMPKEFPIATGLADFYKIVCGGGSCIHPEGEVMGLFDGDKVYGGTASARMAGDQTMEEVERAPSLVAPCPPQQPLTINRLEEHDKQLSIDHDRIHTLEQQMQEAARYIAELRQHLGLM